MRLLTLVRIPFVGIVLLALGAVLAGAWLLAVLAVVLAGAIFVLGRDPERHVPSQPLGVVSPIDGHITQATTGGDPFLNREALVVRIRQGVVAPAVLHSPIEGRVKHIWCGESMPTSEEVAVVAVHLRTDEGDDVVFSASRAWLPGPLRWSVQPGERVGQGQRRGLAGWGRTVSVYMPASSQPAVQSGSRVSAGADVLARLVHAE